MLKVTEGRVGVPDIFSDGVILEENPIDLFRYYESFRKSDNNLTAHELLKKVTNLIEAMLNHDGICLFTTDGKLLGYHLIVDNKVIADDALVGGARTKAFKKLASEPSIYAVLMKTQEGVIQFKKQDNEAR